jgi:hypothetical protein
LKTLELYNTKSKFNICKFKKAFSISGDPRVECTLQEKNQIILQMSETTLVKGEGDMLT